ncbi:sodium/glucose cotransporter 4-like isoform X2 [Lytechinus variegatus]|uniref:sodium/glucose cotransporter 4-like isoform X2 n=1 Tax=Lytechinus variegatus TaxID=7654 RepID=UPI001BB1422A|nr:sodium/glucose cotransporter 4-like isoform X2 [Lytechinus variegatus]
MGNLVANGKIEIWDIVIIVVNFLGVFACGIWASFGRGKDSTSGYFLAGRQMPWYMVTTVPEYLKLRFGGNRLQISIAIINLILVAVIMLASEMYASSLVIQQSLGWDLYTSIIVLLLMTAVYTVAGGLKAVIYTDAIQAVIMMIGAFVLMFIALSKIDWSIDVLREDYMSAIPNTTGSALDNTSCGVPTEKTWHIFRPANDSGLPWPGAIFGALVLGCYFWCTSQVIVQRTLAARNVTHAKGACIMTGYFKILPMFLMIIPGMISRSLWPDEIACVDPSVCQEVCGNPAGCSDIAYPRLVVQLMPTGLRGLMLASMLAAMVSSLTSIFNASSSMFVIDIWSKFRPASTELELVIIGKLATVVMVVVGVLWIPILQAYGTGELFTYIQAVNAYLAPAVLAVFTTAVLWKRVNETGAFWGLLCGFVIGFTRAILDFVFGVPSCGQEDRRPRFISQFHFLHFAAFLYVFSLILIIVISLLTKPQPPQKLVRLTWWTRLSNLPREPMGEKDEEKEKIQEEIRKQAEIRYRARTGLVWRIINIICCIHGNGGSQNDHVDMESDVREEKEPEIELKTAAYENTKWARFALVNGIFLGITCITVLAYYG